MKQMLSIADFIFSVYSDTDYHQLVRVAESGFSEVQRAAQYPSTQRSGKKLESMTLNGQILGAQGGKALDKLRALINSDPQLLMNGSGENLGQWRVQRVTETSDKLIDDGTALKTTFKVELKEYQP